MSAEIIALVGLVIGRLDVIGTVVLLVQSYMAMVFGEMFAELEEVHSKLLVAAEIVVPTSNVVVWADIENAVKAGD